VPAVVIVGEAKIFIVTALVLLHPLAVVMVMIPE
jgi:hypothetical protein